MRPPDGKGREIFGLLLGMALLFSLPSGVSASVGPEDEIHIFFSAGCADCWPYVEQVMVPALREGGIEAPTEIHDFTVPDERARLLEMADEIGLPRSIADSLYAFVPLDEGELVILGHVPPDLIGEILSSPDRPVQMVVWQPEMHGETTEYRLWAWRGEVSTFDINTPFQQALPQALAASGPLPVGSANLGQLLPAVIVTGLVDSVNPCAFAVILLLLAFLFTIRQSRSRILKLGFVYIGLIFLVYFAIGLGILRAVRFSDDPHFVARAGSWILIGLGVINLIEYFFPRFPVKLHMPAVAGDKTNELLKQATVPATVGVGLLVGLCTFPCSGGVYVSIITLLNARTTLGWGVGYLALYNVLFVLPLVVILLGAGNRAVAKRWARWEREHSRPIRLWYGLIMVGLGAAMLFWVIG
jgi:cytochrome c-type biogenesis protein